MIHLTESALVLFWVDVVFACVLARVTVRPISEVPVAVPRRSLITLQHLSLSMRYHLFTRTLHSIYYFILSYSSTYNDDSRKWCITYMMPVARSVPRMRLLFVGISYLFDTMHCLRHYDTIAAWHKRSTIKISVYIGYSVISWSIIFHHFRGQIDSLICSSLYSLLADCLLKVYIYL